MSLISRIGPAVWRLTSIHIVSLAGNAWIQAPLEAKNAETQEARGRREEEKEEKGKNTGAISLFLAFKLILCLLSLLFSASLRLLRLCVFCFKRGFYPPISCQ